jgi:hypothetical protein
VSGERGTSGAAATADHSGSGSGSWAVASASPVPAPAGMIMVVSETVLQGEISPVAFIAALEAHSGATITIVSYVQTLSMLLSIPVDSTSFIGFSDTAQAMRSQLVAGISAALSINTLTENVRILSVDGILVGRRRKLNSLGCAIEWTAVATRDISTLVSDSDFTNILVASINSAGSAMDTLHPSEINMSAPVVATVITFATSAAPVTDIEPLGDSAMVKALRLLSDIDLFVSVLNAAAGGTVSGATVDIGAAGESILSAANSVPAGQWQSPVACRVHAQLLDGRCVCGSGYYRRTDNASCVKRTECGPFSLATTPSVTQDTACRFGMTTGSWLLVSALFVLVASGCILWRHRCGQQSRRLVAQQKSEAVDFSHQPGASSVSIIEISPTIPPAPTPLRRDLRVKLPPLQHRTLTADAATELQSEVKRGTSSGENELLGEVRVGEPDLVPNHVLKWELWAVARWRRGLTMPGT